MNIQDKAVSLKTFKDTMNKYISMQNPSYEGMRTLGRCLLYYGGAKTVGSTNDEIAEKISKYDIVVGVQDVSEGIRPEIYLRKAKELNPNIKIFDYIATASLRNEKMLDDNYNWDPSFSDVPIQTKWEMLQDIEKLSHIGGTESGEKQFIETITYTKDGAQVTEDKYVKLYKNGFTPDGIFWDEFDYDNPTSCKNQGFKNIREKHNYLLTFARERGMCSMANAWSLTNELSDEVNNMNPDGLHHKFTKEDFFLLESQETRNGYSNETAGMKWMPINTKMYDYYKNYYSTVGAKLVAMSYCTWSLDDLSINRWRTWCMLNTLVQGGHYIGLYDRLSLSEPYQIPEIVKLFYYPDSDEYKTTRVGDGNYKLKVNGNTLETKINNVIVGMSIDNVTLNKTTIKINDSGIGDAFSDVARFSSAVLNTIKEYEDNTSKNIDNFDQRLTKAESSRESNLYSRMFIDDWINKPKYTNLLPENALYDLLNENRSKMNKLVKNEDGTITFNIREGNICSTSTYQSSNYILYAFPSSLYRKNLIVGFKGDYRNYKDQGVRYVKANSDNNPLGVRFNYSKCDYFDDNEMYSYAFLDTNNLNETYVNPYHPAWSFGIYLEFKLNTDYTVGDFFAFDINEEFPDYTKTNYTNVNNPYINQINNGKVATASLIGRDATITWKKGATYETDWWSTQVSFGFSFKVTPGHKYEIGYETIETNASGLNIQALLTNWSGTSGFSKGTSIDATQKYFKIVSIDELSTETTYKMLIQIGFPGAGNPVGSYTDSDGVEHDYFATVKGLYVYDKDEQDVIVRGESPSSARIMMSRVTKESFKNDIENDKIKINTLYIIRDENNECSLAITDIGGKINYFTPSSIVSSINNLQNGSKWVKVVMQNGSSTPDNTETLSVKKHGNIVYMTGQISVTSENAETIIANIPDGFRPVKYFRQLVPRYDMRFGNIEVRSNGNIIMISDTDLNESIKTYYINMTWVSADIDCASITINVTDYKTTQLGETKQLTATVIPSNTTDSVKWETSNSNVATVTNEGLVKITGYGVAIITARCGTRNAICKITVKKS